LRFVVEIAAPIVIVDPPVVAIAIERDGQSLAILVHESRVRGTLAWSALHLGLISMNGD
jgi:hypothetical protein